MKVFLSWSGGRSGAVATALKELLPSMIHPVSCWMSDASMAKGRPWFEQLKGALDDIVFGIFCVTPENEPSVWLQWEAGFLSSKASIGDRRVAPLAIGMSKGALNGPLSIYQATDATRVDVLRLVKDINLALPEGQRIAESTLETTYGFIWPELETRIKAAIALPVAAPTPPTPSTGDQLAQIVALLRDNQRETAETKAMVRLTLMEAQALYQGRIFAGSDPTTFLRNSSLAGAPPELGSGTITPSSSPPITLRGPPISVMPVPPGASILDRPSSASAAQKATKSE
jgi:hypothetical protein